MFPSVAAPARTYPRLSKTMALSGHRTAIDLGHHWARAYDLWLDSHPSPNTRRAYQHAYYQFQAFTDRPPWQVTKTHIAAWHDYLRRQCLARSTIQQRLAALLLAWMNL